MEDVPSFKINKMIYHKDSVYIRCIGLLFARYKFYNDEERLMKFFSEDVFKDTNDASFSPSVDTAKLTSFSTSSPSTWWNMGVWVISESQR